jgi:hypothetical protein
LKDATKEIRVLEEKLLSGEFRRDRKAVAGLLAEGFREFGSSGRVWSKQEILDQLEKEKPFEAEIKDFQAVELAAAVVLVTYKVTIGRPGAESASSLRSSIWVKREDGWRILFHQGTATERSWSEYLKSGTAASEEFMDGVEDLPVQERERLKRTPITKAAIDEALRVLHRKTGHAPEPGDELPKGYRRGSLRKRAS